MPNGMDKDFVRFMSSIASFHKKFGHWSTKVRVEPGFSEELVEVMGLKDYGKLINKLQLIADPLHPYDGTYIAEDDQGNAYDLLVSGHLGVVSDAVKWLDIAWPDYYRHFLKAK